MVVLDTNIFKGIPPRNWGKTFRNFISKHLIGKKFLTFDENGKEEIIEFAKPNERVTKNGANNSHKVIDKLSRKSDRNSKLVIVHSDEVINISEKQNENAEHSHQWLDENGWEFRNAFVMDKYGKIYSVTLNIAKSKDGRNILYDINKINEVGYGDVLSNAKGKRSSHINPNFVTNSISQSENNVNTKNDESSNDIKYSMGGLKAETADKSALEKAMELEKDGTDSEKIRKETGWFKGYDGKWRFEIDNSELEFKTDIEKNRAAAIELAKMKVKSAELEEKIVNNTATKAEENEYYNLDEKMIEYRKGVKLSDVINHPKLFEAYPQLKNVDVYYEISSVNRGVYSSNGNVIMLNPMHTIDEQKEAIIHEIQHAIQGIENFANGSNLEYWKNLGYSDEEAMAMYYNTAGEREARDVSARRDYNAEQRKNIRPDIDRKDVVFANSGDAGYLTDKDFTKYDNLETLDDKEIKVYNKRGWAYGLFNREDMKLLNEKFSELDRRLNSRTDNMLADGTRIVEVNNKIVSIGGTYNDPEIYSVLLINAENETYAEYVKEEILGYVNEQRNYSRRKYEEIWETTPFVYGEENIRHYNAYDYIYKKGGDDTGLRATLPGDFSRYGYNKESNIRGTSDANAKGEVSAVQLDEDTSDIKYATDDTINDWLDDEFFFTLIRYLSIHSVRSPSHKNSDEPLFLSVIAFLCYYFI